MSSLTAITILPQSARNAEAPCSPAPDFRARRAVGELQENHRTHIGQRLVHHHAPDALYIQLIAQVRQEHRLIRHFLDHARFARRHLADDRSEHRRSSFA